MATKVVLVTEKRRKYDDLDMAVRAAAIAMSNENLVEILDNSGSVLLEGVELVDMAREERERLGFKDDGIRRPEPSGLVEVRTGRILKRADEEDR